MDPSVAFGRVLRRLRLKAGLTQEQLGFEAGIRRTYVSILELGEQQPTLSTILKLAAALGVRGSMLLDMTEEEITGTTGQ